MERNVARNCQDLLKLVRQKRVSNGELKADFRGKFEKILSCLLGGLAVHQEVVYWHDGHLGPGEHYRGGDHSGQQEVPLLRHVQPPAWGVESDVISPHNQNLPVSPDTVAMAASVACWFFARGKVAWKWSTMALLVLRDFLAGLSTRFT